MTLLLDNAHHSSVSRIDDGDRTLLAAVDVKNDNVRATHGDAVGAVEALRIELHIDNAHQRPITRVEFGDRVVAIVHPHATPTHCDGARDVQSISLRPDDSYQRSVADVELHHRTL